MGKLRIISYSGKAFRDRQEAGQLLAQELAELKGQGVVVLGIPRGGIVVARELALGVAGDLDIVLSRKLRTPGYPELAMGSVDEDGHVYINDEVMRQLPAGKEAIEREKEFQMREIKRRTELIRQVLPKMPLKDRIVVITDDGVATGATTQAAIWSARHEEPGKLIATIPVGAEETIRRLADDVDEMVCLRCPPFFAAVGQFYLRFGQVEDEDVLKILREEAGRRNKASPEGVGR
ncbi:MAG: phosphoribosyltransferase [Chloroflexi bacterium]|nr:phosphoribosyltransferase [Chloroflexota bacterium]